MILYFCLKPCQTGCQAAIAAGISEEERTPVTCDLELPAYGSPGVAPARPTPAVASWESKAYYFLLEIWKYTEISSQDSRGLRHSADPSGYKKAQNPPGGLSSSRDPPGAARWEHDRSTVGEPEVGMGKCMKSSHHQQARKVLTSLTPPSIIIS